MSGEATEREERFSAYVEALACVLGHADREKPLSDYCRGLLTDCERKSVEPLAAITAPDRTAAQHQSLLHFVGNGGWSDERVLAKVGELVLPALQRKGPIEAWIIDDTGFPRRGRTRSASRTNIAGKGASRRTARSPYRCLWPTQAAVCRWPTGCTCRRPGPGTPAAARRLTSRKTSSSRPSPRSRSNTSALRLPRAVHAGSC